VIYFPHRGQLNDPFDSNVEVIRAIDNAIEASECKFPDLLRQFRHDEEMIARFHSGVASMGIGSFSLTHRETLLWSHYANDHRGVVIRYDFPSEFLSDENNILGVSRVSYDPNAISTWLRDNIQLYKDNHFQFVAGLLRKVLMSKAPAWSHEQEAGIVRPVAGPYEVPRSALTHVFFGLQTSTEDEQLIREIIDKFYKGVGFGRVVRTSDDFGVEIIEV
jgi:hypothetical protein